MFSAHSDWLLKLGIAFDIPLLLRHVSGLRARDLPFILTKKELFGAGYPLVWYILKQLFTSVSVKSGSYLPRRLANIHHY